MIRLTRAQSKTLIDTANQLNEAIQTGGVFNIGPDFVELMKNLQDQMDRPEWERDIIDILTDALRQPRAGAILGGDTIDELRQAILRPREIAALQQSIGTKMSCESCGRVMPAGTMATVSTRRATTVVCVACERPSSISCANDRCKTRIPLSDAIGRIIKKLWSSCTGCAAKREGVPEPAVGPAPVHEIERLANEIRRREEERLPRNVIPPPPRLTNAPQTFTAGATRTIPNTMLRWGQGEELMLPRDLEER